MKSPESQLSAAEIHAVTDISAKVTQLHTFVTNTTPPSQRDLMGWYKFLVGIKTILGNANNDISFIATLMAKEFLEADFPTVTFDATTKSQNAPGLDIDLTLPDGHRIVGEIKTTIPVLKNDFGSQQRDEFQKDFAKLQKSGAEYKFFFVTERRSFDLLRKAMYRKKITGTRVVLLTTADEFTA